MISVHPNITQWRVKGTPRTLSKPKPAYTYPQGYLYIVVSGFSVQATSFNLEGYKKTTLDFK